MKTSFILSLVIVSLSACSSDDSLSVDDGSVGDTTITDAKNDVLLKDGAVDVAVDAGVDAPVDAAEEPDATNDASEVDAADAGVDDASLDGDAPDDAPADAPSDVVVIDAGKGCKGIFCIVGDTCCNNISSVNYGKCEPTSCGSCCL